MGRLRERLSEKVSARGTAARLWWVALGTVATAAVLVLAATTVSEATSHPATTSSSAPSVAALRSALCGVVGPGVERLEAEHFEHLGVGSGLGVHIDARHGGHGERRVRLRLVDLHRHGPDELGRLLQRRGYHRDVRRHGHGTGTGGQPTRPSRRRPTSSWPRPRRRGQVRQPVGGHRGRLRPGHQSERTGRALRQLGRARRGLDPSNPSSWSTPTRSRARCCSAPCTSARRPARPGPTSAAR